MQTNLNPYLSFRDNARQAMEFYRSVFFFEKPSTGGEITMSLEKAPWGDTFGMCTD